MKTILFTLTLLVSFVSFSQQLKQTFTVDTNLTEEEKLKYSGMELQSYSKEFYSGLKLIGGGQALLWSGLYTINNSKIDTPIYMINPDGSKEFTHYEQETNYGKKTLGVALTVIGGALTLIGTHHTLEAPIHIKNAGLILSGNGVGIVIKM